MSQSTAASKWPSVTFSEMPPETEVTERVLDLHTFVNLLNVTAGVLSWAGGRQPTPAVKALMERITEATSAFLESDGTSVEALIERPEFRNALVSLKHEWSQSGKTAELAAILTEILTLFDGRLRGYQEFKRQPGARDSYRSEELRAVLLRFFRATSVYSGGRFQVVESAVEPSDGSHHVEFDFDAGESGVFTLPPVALDCLYDLVANARKYSPSGGQMRIEVRQQSGGVCLAVQDQGMGIPEEELRRVVRFGYRARNAGAIATMGGGFGLTKALSVAVRYGGHLQIASRLLEGTRVELFLPHS